MKQLQLAIMATVLIQGLVTNEVKDTVAMYKKMNANLTGEYGIWGDRNFVLSARPFIHCCPLTSVHARNVLSSTVVLIH